ncbi:condensation domain-containing protein [Streptomyces sp. M19]
MTAARGSARRRAAAAVAAATAGAGQPGVQHLYRHRADRAAEPLALRSAIHRIGCRHEMLRAAFTDDGAEPAQYITASPPPLRLVDLSGPMTRTRGGGGPAARHGRRPAVRPDRGPPVCWLLLRLEPRRHLLVLSVHHLVFDGGSLAVVREEIEALYRHAATGTRRPARADSALSASRRPATEMTESAAESVAFWREALGAAPPRSSPFGGGRNAGPPGRAGRPGLPARTPRRAAGPGGTRRSGTAVPTDRQHDVHGAAGRPRLSGRPVLRPGGRGHRLAGRPARRGADRRHRRPADQHRAAAAAAAREPDFTEVLARARNTLLDALEHRLLPFERIVDTVGPPRSWPPPRCSRCSSRTSGHPDRPACRASTRDLSTCPPPRRSTS